MAIYVYMLGDGSLYSWCPGDLDQVAPPDQLAAQGMASKSGLHPLDSSHIWDPITKNVVVIIAPKSTPFHNDFWKRFTQAEREGIENLLATAPQAIRNKINAFRTYLLSTSMIDCNDPYILSSIQALETAGVLAPGRAAQIMV